MEDPSMQETDLMLRQLVNETHSTQHSATARAQAPINLQNQLQLCTIYNFPALSTKPQLMLEMRHLHRMVVDKQ